MEYPLPGGPPPGPSGATVLQPQPPVQDKEVVGPDQATANILWKWLVMGLVTTVGLAGIGVIVTVAIGHGNDTILTVFSTALAALVGLFVKSPTQ
jgi:hypothetical protein